MFTPSTQQLLNDYLNDIDAKTPELTVKEDPSDTELILGCLACLQEECGELATEVRKLTKMSFSQKKVSQFNPQDLEDEAVDVYIVLNLLLKRLGITNLDEAVQRKIGKNKARGY